MKYKAQLPFVLILLLSVASTCQARVVKAVGWTDAQVDLFVKIGSSYEPLSFMKARRSSPVDIDNEKELFFYSDIPTKDKPLPPIARVSLVGASEDELLIFVPKGRGQWHVLNRPDGVDDFPANSFDILNFTSDQIGGIIADQKVLLDPREEKRIRLNSWEERAFPIQLNNREIDKDYSYPYVRSTQRFRPGIRVIFILVEAAASQDGIPRWAVVDRAPIQ